jgi:hypothetical protein
MGPASLAPWSAQPKNPAETVAEMSTLLEEIHALIEAPAVERARVERTLTDGYAHALNLEVNGLRLQKRVDALTGDTHEESRESAKELRVLAKQLDGNAGELSTLRTVLAQLRRRIRT